MLDIKLVHEINVYASDLRKLFHLSDQDDFKPVSYCTLSKKIKDYFPFISINSSSDSKASFSEKKGKNTYQITIESSLSEEDKIECLMHEMAHIILHSENMQIGKPIGRYTGTIMEEKEADCFSRAFLIPQEVFIKALAKNSRNDGSVIIEELAKFFNVNESLIIERGRDLMIWN